MVWRKLWTKVRAMKASATMILFIVHGCYSSSSLLFPWVGGMDLNRQWELKEGLLCFRAFCRHSYQAQRHGWKILVIINLCRVSSILYTNFVIRWSWTDLGLRNLNLTFVINHSWLWFSTWWYHNLYLRTNIFYLSRRQVSRYSALCNSFSNAFPFFILCSVSQKLSTSLNADVVHSSLSSNMQTVNLTWKNISIQSDLLLGILLDLIIKVSEYNFYNISK